MLPTYSRTRRIQRRTRIHRHPQRSTRRTRATNITALRATYSPTDRHTVACQRFEGELYQKQLHLLHLPDAVIFFFHLFLTTFNSSFMPPTGSLLLLVDISRLGHVFTGITDAIGATIRTSLLVSWMRGFPLKL